MKMISSLVRPARLDAVKRALAQVDVVGLTVVEARDYAPQQRASTVWRGYVLNADSSMKLEVQVIVHDDDVDTVVDQVLRAARTRSDGDGYVCVLTVDHRYSISSGRREV